jgi:hypothetical protein
MITEEKNLLNAGFLRVRSAIAICETRAIEPSTRVMMTVDTDRKMSPQRVGLPTMRAVRAVMSGDRYSLYNLASNDATVAMGVRGWTYLSLMFLPRWLNSAPYFTRKPISSILWLGRYTNACLARRFGSSALLRYRT